MWFPCDFHPSPIKWDMHNWKPTTRFWFRSTRFNIYDGLAVGLVNERNTFNTNFTGVAYTVCICMCECVCVPVHRTPLTVSVPCRTLLQSPEGPEGKEASKVTKQEVNVFSAFVCCAWVCKRVFACCVFLYWEIVTKEIGTWHINEWEARSSHQTGWVRIRPQRYNWYLSLSLCHCLSLSLIIPCPRSPSEGQRDCQRWVSFCPPCLHLCHCLLTHRPAVPSSPPQFLWDI